MSPMVRRTITNEYALLGFLKQGPLHGYQLHQELNNPNGVGRTWRVKQAQLYAWLEKLESDGYVTSSMQPQETRPARRVYRITDKGQHVFDEWLSTPVQAPRQMRQEFQLKLFFAQREGQETLKYLIELQHAACLIWLKNHQTIAGIETEVFSYPRMVDQYRIGQIQAMIDWLEFCARDYL